MDASVVEQTVDAFKRALDAGLLGLAVVLGICIIVLAAVLFFALRGNNRNQGTALNLVGNMLANRDNQLAVSMRAGDEKIAAAIIQRDSSVIKLLEDTKQVISENNVGRAEQIAALHEQTDQMKALRLDVKGWPETTSNALHVLEKSVSDHNQAAEGRATTTGNNQRLTLESLERIEKQLANLLDVVHSAKTEVLQAISNTVAEPGG